MSDVLMTPVFKAEDLPQHPIFDLLVSELRKGLTEQMGSVQGRTTGEQIHPIDFSNAQKLMFAVNIQETCIRTKRDATVGLGFETEEERQEKDKQKQLSQRAHEMAMEGPSAKPKPKPPSDPKQALAKAVEEASKLPLSKAEQVLNELCGDDGLQSLLNQLGEDYENMGNCYIEVVRDGGKIVALWHAPAATVKVVNEDQKPHFHFKIEDLGGTHYFARFGDLEGFLERNPDLSQPSVDGKTRSSPAQESEDGDDDEFGGDVEDDDRASMFTELIQIKQPTSFSQCYGLPSWLSCTPWLELAQKVMQYDFDYFDNRAVPDLMVLLTGAKVPEKDMDSIKGQVKETVGAGKRHRTIVANLPHPETKAQVERLQADNRERFSDLWTNIQLQIVSTHRVPPLLAGVVLPGKMAAANELPNALVAFQTLYISQHQRMFQHRLGATLGSEEAGLGLGPDDFVFRKITDFYDMGEVDTMSRMRESVTEAAANGRDLEDGLKD